MIRYTVTGATMVLDQVTTDALDTGDSDASAVEREVRRDAETLAASLGRKVTVEAANGIELRRLGAEVQSAVTYEQYWLSVIGDVDAETAVSKYDLVPGDFRGFSEWLDEAEAAAGLLRGSEGLQHHDRAARELQAAAGPEVQS